MLLRPSALRLIAISLVALQLGALTHGALALHVTADNGAVVEGCPQKHALVWAEGAAFAGRDESPGHHHEAHHCAALAFQRSLAPLGSIGSSKLAQRSPGCERVQPVSRRAFNGVPVLRLAPKASPPREA
jgi:hypothetical protein